MAFLGVLGQGGHQVKVFGEDEVPRGLVEVGAVTPDAFGGQGLSHLQHGVLV